jgi:hypothetical protein
VSKINIHVNLGCNLSKSTINNNKIKFPEKEKKIKNRLSILTFASMDALLSSHGYYYYLLVHQNVNNGDGEQCCLQKVKKGI